MKDMEAFGIKIDTNVSFINPNFKLVAYPAIALGIMATLSVMALTTGYSKVKTQISEFNSAAKNEEILETKVNVLREIASGILVHTDTSITAMPSNNPILWTYSQVKKQAEKHEVELSEITFGRSSGGEGLGGATISFDMQGDVQKMIDYMKDASNLAPVLTLGEVELEEDPKTGFIAKTELTAYWADLPTKIPPLTQPIKGLTPSEEELLSRLAILDRPEFTVLDKAEGSSGRIDPFN